VLGALPKVLPGCIVELREAAEAAVGEEKLYVPPLEAIRLSHSQVSALEVVIRATVQADIVHPAGDAEQDRPTNQIGPVSPAFVAAVR
jgi:hypothetical protein